MRVFDDDNNGTIDFDEFETVSVATLCSAALCASVAERPSADGREAARRKLPRRCCRIHVVRSWPRATFSIGSTAPWRTADSRYRSGCCGPYFDTSKWMRRVPHQPADAWDRPGRTLLAAFNVFDEASHGTVGAAGFSKGSDR